MVMFFVPFDSQAHFTSLVSVSYDMLGELLKSLRRFDALCSRYKSVTWE